MKTFHVLAVALAVSLSTQTQTFATTVLIDDSKDALTMSINGVNITGFPSLGTCSGGFCQVVTNFLIEPGSPPSTPESATIGWDDFSLGLPPGLGTNESFTSPLLLLMEGPNPGGLPAISDQILVFVQNNGGVATRIEVMLFSDFGESGLGSCPAETNCVDLGLETGAPQDITGAALSNLPGGVPGLTILVSSDATETTVPEPPTVLLLAAALAVLAAWRTRRGRRLGITVAALVD